MKADIVEDTLQALKKAQEEKQMYHVIIFDLKSITTSKVSLLISLIMANRTSSCYSVFINRKGGPPGILPLAIGSHLTRKLIWTS